MLLGEVAGSTGAPVLGLAAAAVCGTASPCPHRTTPWRHIALTSDTHAHALAHTSPSAPPHTPLTLDPGRGGFGTCPLPPNLAQHGVATLVWHIVGSRLLLVESRESAHGEGSHSGVTITFPCRLIHSLAAATEDELITLFVCSEAGQLFSVRLPVDRSGAASLHHLHADCVWMLPGGLLPETSDLDETPSSQKLLPRCISCGPASTSRQQIVVGFSNGATVLVELSQDAADMTITELTPSFSLRKLFKGLLSRSSSPGNPHKDVQDIQILPVQTTRAVSLDSSGSLSVFQLQKGSLLHSVDIQAALALYLGRHVELALNLPSRRTVRRIEAMDGDTLTLWLTYTEDHGCSYSHGFLHLEPECLDRPDPRSWESHWHHFVNSPKEEILDWHSTETGVFVLGYSEEDPEPVISYCLSTTGEWAPTGWQYVVPEFSHLSDDRMDANGKPAEDLTLGETYWMWKLFLSGDIPLSVVHAVLQQSVTDWVGGRGVPVEVPFISRDQVKEQLVAHMEHVVQLQRMDSLNPVAGAPMLPLDVECCQWLASFYSECVSLRNSWAQPVCLAMSESRSGHSSYRVLCGALTQSRSFSALRPLGQCQRLLLTMREQGEPSQVPEAWILHNLQNDEIKLLRSAALVSHALGASRLSFLEFSCRCSNKPLAILEQELPDLFEDMPNASAEGLAMVVSELFNTSLNPASALRHIFQRLGESIRVVTKSGDTQDIELGPEEESLDLPRGQNSPAGLPPLLLHCFADTMTQTVRVLIRMAALTSFVLSHVIPRARERLFSAHAEFRSTFLAEKLTHALRAAVFLQSAFALQQSSGPEDVSAQVGTCIVDTFLNRLTLDYDAIRVCPWVTIGAGKPPTSYGLSGDSLAATLFGARSSSCLPARFLEACWLLFECRQFDLLQRFLNSSEGNTLAVWHYRSMCHLYGGRVVQATDAFLHAVRVVDPVHPLEKGLCRETSRSMDVDPTAVDEDSRLVLAHREIMLKQVSKWTDSRGELGPSGGTSIAEESFLVCYCEEFMRALKSVDQVDLEARVARFMLTIPSISPQLRGQLWSRLFNAALTLGEFEEAYVCIVRQSDMSRKRSSLKFFITELMKRRRGDLILSFSFTGLREMLEDVLWKKARSMQLAQSSSNYFHLLFSIFVHQGKLVEAAAAMFELGERYEKSSRSGAEEMEFLHQQRAAYSQSMNCLLLLSSPASDPPVFFLPETSLGSFSSRGQTMSRVRSREEAIQSDDFRPEEDHYEGEMLPNSTTKVMISLHEVQQRCALLSCRFELASRNLRSYRTMAKSPQGILVHLLKHGLFDQAISLALVYDMDVMDEIFTKLTEKCIRKSIEGSEFSVTSSGRHLSGWDYLKMLLRKLDSPSNGIRFHKVVLEYLLNSHRSFAFPKWLIQSFDSWCPDMLCRILCQHGEVRLALEEVETHLRTPDMLPVNVLDFLATRDSSLEDAIQEYFLSRTEGGVN